MITSLSWVPKGAAKAVSDRAELPSKEEIEKLKESCDQFYSEDEEEISKVVALAKAVAKEFGEYSKSKNASSSMEVNEVKDGLEELDMDNYDEEDDGIEIFSSGRGDLYYASNEMDPYLKNNDDHDDDSDDDETVLQTDSMIVCAKSKNKANTLDVYICEETSNGSKNIFGHDEIYVPKLLVCTAWLDCPLKGGEKGNFLAVGSDKTSKIEIWDLDVKNEVLPCVQLGGKHNGMSNNYREGSHTGPVLDLAWNKEFRNILASASFDKQVKVWDVAIGTCKITKEHHTMPVQAVAWNHFSHEVLLSGSFDQTVVLKDVRKPSQSGFKWSVLSDVQSLAWDPHSEHFFVVSLKDGTVKGFDVRQASNSASDLEPSFTLHAHDEAVTSISYNISAPSLLATGSVDKTVKLWDLSNSKPSCIASHTPNAGDIFSIAFSPDYPFFLAIGGSTGELKFWDTLSNTNVSQIYGSNRV